VACWNACDGMPQDDVEELAKMPNGVMNLTVYADDLLKERDELVKALRLWMHFFGGDHEDAIMTIAEDGSTLTEPQEVTARILARYQERKS